MNYLSFQICSPMYYKKWYFKQVCHKEQQSTPNGCKVLWQKVKF